MARSAPHIDDGLELLLDTVCNMFGGILFLALLICMQYNATSEMVDRPSNTDADIEQVLALKQIKNDVTVLKDSLEVSQERVATQETLLTALGGQIDQEILSELRNLQLREYQLHQSLNELREVVGDQQRRQSDALEQVEQASRKLEESRAVLSKLHEQAQEARQESAEANAELQELQDRQAVQLRLPRAHATSKKQVAIFLSNDRFRMPYKHDVNGNVIARNEEEVVFEVGSTSVSPANFVPNRGITVFGNRESLQAIDRRLVMFQPNAHYIMIAVWPDSFGSFRQVRDHLIGQGYEYQLLLMGKDEAIYFTSDARNEVQ